MSAAALLLLAGFDALLRVFAAPAPQPMPGQVIVDPEDFRWLKRHEGKPVFICGPGEPEDFLYRGARQPDGTRIGDQRELIEKLIRHGGNCIYLQTVRTHGGDAGDDRTHNPFIDSDPTKGPDARILAQWEEWFALMDRHDILIYFISSSTTTAPASGTPATESKPPSGPFAKASSGGSNTIGT